MVALALIGGLAFLLTRGSSPPPEPAGATSAETQQSASEPAQDEARGLAVASVAELVVKRVGEYRLTDRKAARDLVKRGAVEAIQLTYKRRPASEEDNTLLHTLALFPGAEAASKRVAKQVNALEREAWEVIDEDEVTDSEGAVQGVYVLMSLSVGRYAPPPGEPTTYLLWSNGNAYFSVGGDASFTGVEQFYEQLPYCCLAD